MADRLLVNRLALKALRGSLPAVAEVDLPPNFAQSAVALALGDELLDLKLPCDDRWQSLGGRELAKACAAGRGRAAAQSCG